MLQPIELSGGVGATAQTRIERLVGKGDLGDDRTPFGCVAHAEACGPQNRVDPEDIQTGTDIAHQHVAR